MAQALGRAAEIVHAPGVPRAAPLALALLGLGCAAGETSPAAPAAPADSAPGLPDRSVETCPLGQSEARPLALRAVAALGEAAGKTWLVALAPSGAAELLHLGRQGELVRTPLPQWTERVAVEGEGLRFVVTEGRPTWWWVDLRDPDAPVVGRSAPISGLPAGSHPRGVASDGAAALVSLYRAATGPGPLRYEGDTYLLDVASGALRSGPLPATVWSAACAGGRCFGVAARNASPDALALVEAAPAGLRVVLELGPGCGGLTTWREGQVFYVAWSEPQAVGAAALDLSTGTARAARSAVPGSRCPAIEALTLAGERGLLLRGEDQPASFAAISPALTLGPPRSLPPLQHREQVFASAGEALLVADFSRSGGLRHGPPDHEGVREYHQVYGFEGRHGLVREGEAGLVWREGGPLPRSGEAGEHADGYRVFALTRPGHAGLLVAGDSALASAYLPILGPCPSGQPR